MKKTFSSENYKYGFSKPEKYVYREKRGLNEGVVRNISKIKGEPKWMLEKRLAAYKVFASKKMPDWAPNLDKGLYKIDLDNIYYYVKPSDKEASYWEDLPKEIKDTYDKIGIPKAEQKYLSGVKAQYESEVVYGSLKKDLEKKGVIFLGMDAALGKYPKLVKEYFGKIVPPNDNKFAALNTAVWSGGSFIYVPRNVKIDLPLQAYFRINAKRMGQFERTLIIADEGSFVSYLEGCTAPVYSTDSLHAAVVEIIVKKNARVRYTTIQNWSKNVFNLVTKRAYVYEDGVMEWVDGNLGSKLTMKYPSVYLMENGAKGSILSLAYAGFGQYQDAGAKAVHLSPNTFSQVVSKSISKSGGRTSYRGIVRMSKSAKNCKSSVVCDALIMDDKSRSDTYPLMKLDAPDAQVGHEASTGKIDEDKLFYLKSRGISENEAVSMVINGFIEPIVKELPMEYSLELNRLLSLEIEGGIG